MCCDQGEVCGADSVFWSWASDFLTKRNVGVLYAIVQLLPNFRVPGVSTLIRFPLSLESVCSSCGLEMRVPDSHFSVSVIDWKSQWINLS